jgi:5-methyltetrahydrofolate--homocysteine methyltransferase
VVNLGIKVGPEALIETARREQPDFIGLSGLLVKSALQMATTAADLKAAGISVPLMVGGAALSRNFADSRIAPQYGAPVLYAKDAMAGLELANRLADPLRRGPLLEELAERQHVVINRHPTDLSDRTDPSDLKSKNQLQSAPILPPPDCEQHILRDVPLKQIIPYLNRQMLYTKHLGLIGSVEKLLAAGDEKALKLHSAVEEMLFRIEREQLIRPQALYRFYPANADGNDLILYAPEGTENEAVRFTFPRQAAGEQLCVADFSRPLCSGERDNMALFVVTCGQGVREQAEAMKSAGDYLDSHLLQALALELAEATAEFLHKRIRTSWGIIDDPALSMKQIYNAEYQGIRVSFGYPACPEISDQQKLFRLLEPETIGVQLTEGDMMDPEASVSALVFHHPQGRYFDVSR